MEDRRRSERKEINARIEFVIDETTRVLEATGIDISEHGIAFSTDQPVKVALTLDVDGEEVTRMARLVRLREGDDGGYVYGLDFNFPAE